MLGHSFYLLQTLSNAKGRPISTWLTEAAFILELQRQSILHPPGKELKIGY
jgi:hypothetical protein